MKNTFFLVSFIIVEFLLNSSIIYAQPCVPSDEICNGIDDDCDGIVDFLGCDPGPQVMVQNTIGGNHTDDVVDIIPGTSASEMSGDKTESSIGPTGLSDYWILKLDQDLNIIWQNTIGGDKSDVMRAVVATSDGGYLLGGYSDSPISGDKTVPSVGPGTAFDYWLVKINSVGDIEWQKIYGGTGTDSFEGMCATSDGGFVLCGYSYSGIGGTKTEANIGNADYWIIKINSEGDIIWQNTIGGNKDDFAYTIKQSADGGYLVGGFSISNISGDKTEACIGGTGKYDYWIVKLNSEGIIVWQNTLGGTETDELHDIEELSDGNILLAGFSRSAPSADKTENIIGTELLSSDYWLVKLDASGNKLWDESIGGGSSDYLFDIEETPDGNYFLMGYSSSTNGYDKVEYNFGQEDYWIMMLDTSRNILWQNSIGGTETDYLRSGHYLTDGTIILGGYSESDDGFDKNENSLGLFDYWIIKIFEEDCTPIPELCNALDDNCNGLIDDDVIETINISADGATTFCQGNSVLLSATYSGASIQWKKNGTNIPGATSSTYSANKTGNFTAITTSPCGTATSSIINVTVNKNPPASITAGGATTFCAGGSVILTANAGGGLSYQWYKGATLVVGATSINYTATTAGNYKCRVTKTATGCYKNSNIISVSVPCKESLETINPEIHIYPNPASEKITINIDNKFTLGSITITDISGKKNNSTKI